MGEPNIKRVLVVEDHPDVALLTAELIKTLGGDPHIARSLAEARKALAEFSPDLILLDYRLPDGAGIELMPDVPDALKPSVVLLTAHDVSSLSAEVRSAVSHICTKPIEFEKLVELLQA